MKVYKSKGIVSINVKVNGKKRHLLFNGSMSGSGVLMVKNPEVAAAVEAHELYGDMFKLYSDDGVQGTEVEKLVAAAKEPAKKANKKPAGDSAGTVVEETAGDAAETVVEEPAGDAAGTVVEFESFDDAREWVNETYGVAKKNLMSKAAVIEAGAANGVEIKFK